MTPGWAKRLRYHRAEPRLEPGLYILPLSIVAIGLALFLAALRGAL